MVACQCCGVLTIGHRSPAQNPDSTDALTITSVNATAGTADLSATDMMMVNSVPAGGEGNDVLTDTTAGNIAASAITAADEVILNSAEAIMTPNSA